MIKRLLVTLTVIGFAFGTTALLAYEVETHEVLSATAVESSVLKNDTDKLVSLGLKAWTASETFPNSSGAPRTITQLFREGTRFEDNGSRSVNHFYDPIHNVPLSVPLLTTSMSPDWALEDKGDIPGQDFSYKNARQYFYDALTAKNPTDRDSNFGKTFETLGHVIHHLQDMAQPQHVRNDPHCDAIVPCLVPGALAGKYSPSLYEKYTKGKDGDLRFDGYAPLYTDAAAFAVFSTPRKLWRTSPEGQADISQGMGLAEYTNRNFVSSGTNFDKPGLFPSPVFDPANKEEVDIKTLIPGTDLSGIVTFYGNTVRDVLRPNETRPNPRGSTESIFDAELMKAGYQPLFTLNRFNFDAALEFLIPRAVAYSAGLIDYFFRGRLGAEEATFTDTGISLRVRNAIDVKENPQLKNEALAKEGNVVATVEYKIPDPNAAGGFKTMRTVSTSIPLGETLYPGEMTKQSLAFDLPEIPDGAKDVSYRLVYRGKLAQEQDAVAVGVVKPAAGFLVRPNYVPADGIAGPRMIYRNHGKWKLSDRTDVKAGGIDWKGWYEDGKPTEVLSWNGGPRHSTDLFVFAAGSNPEIYKNGELFAIAPAGVLGAALNRTSAEEWLIAVVKIGGADVVYRRPNKKSSSPALFNALTEPEGWQEIGRNTYPMGMFFGVNPWFFNGEGTEAQTIRHIDAAIQDRLNRLKLTVSGTLVTFQDLQNETGIRIERTNDSGFWNNAEPYPCVKNQSGTASLRYQVTNNQSGKYIVAVDYKNDKEVLATIEGTGGGTFTENASYAWNTGNCGSTWKVTGATDARHYESNFRLELVVDNTRIKLDNKTDLIDTLTTWEGAFARLLTGNATKNAGRWSLEQLAYLDLREELYGGIEFLEPDAKVISTFSTQTGQFCSQSTDLADFQHLVHRISEDIIVQKDPRDYSTQYCRPDNGGPAAPWNYIYGLEPTELLPQLAVRRKIIYPTRNSGSWVVDAVGNLAASQKISPNQGYFNKITAGELISIIPPALGEAYYYPINVIW